MERMGCVPRFREKRGPQLCSRLLIKHDLVSTASVMPGLIFDDALYFSFCAPFNLFKWCGAIGRTTITMTDGFPGGRSAVAKILGGGEDSPRFQQPQMRSDATFYLECKERVFPLVWQANPRETLACVYNICLTFWSWLCTQGSIHTRTHTLVCMRETDEVRWWNSQKHNAFKLIDMHAKYAQK